MEDVKKFFKGYICPDNGDGCARPYCHFSHTRSGRSKSEATDKTQKYSSLFTTESRVVKNTLSQSGASNINNEPNTNRDKNLVIKADEEFIVSRPVEQSSVDSIVAESESDTLQQLVSEAVKKVIAESSSLDISDADRNALIDKAVAEVSNKSKELNISSSKLSVNKPKLYLPPPGTPNYKPTPITELQHKSLRNSDGYQKDEEYTPTPIVSVDNSKPSEDGEITDFSSAEDEEKNNCDFDMLEEVIAEYSLNPVRNKAIQKRKKALGRQSYRDISSQNRSDVCQDKPKEISNQNQNIDMNHDTSSAPSLIDEPMEQFLPPSPVFTSSSEMVLKDNIFATSQGDCDKNENVMNISGGNLFSQDTNTINEEKPNIVKEGDNHSGNSPSSKFSHTFLPNIVSLSRPNTKIWTPVAKVSNPPAKSADSVETMLEKLHSDSSSSDTQMPINCNKELENSGIKNESKNSDPDNCKGNSSFIAEKSVNTNDSDNEDIETDKHGSRKKHKKRSRSSNSDHSSDSRERKKRKKKKSHKESSRKRHHRDHSDDSEDATSDSENEKATQRRGESNSEEKYTKSKGKKSKRMKHWSHRHRKKRYKYKKRGKDKKHGRHSSEKKRHYSSDTDDNSSEEDRDDEMATVPPIDPADIKKEKEDPDVFIVKIEKVDNVAKLNTDGTSNTICTTPVPDANERDKGKKATATTNKTSSKKKLDNEKPIPGNGTASQINVSSNANLETVKLVRKSNSSKVTENSSKNSKQAADSVDKNRTNLKCSEGVSENLESKDVNVKEQTMKNVVKTERINSSSKVDSSNNEGSKGDSNNKFESPKAMLSIFDMVASKVEQTSKTRVLTEVSLFDSLEEAVLPKKKLSSGKSNKLSGSSKSQKAESAKKTDRQLESKSVGKEVHKKNRAIGDVDKVEGSDCLLSKSKSVDSSSEKKYLSQKSHRDRKREDERKKLEHNSKHSHKSSKDNEKHYHSSSNKTDKVRKLSSAKEEKSSSSHRRTKSDSKDSAKGHEKKSKHTPHKASRQSKDYAIKKESSDKDSCDSPIPDLSALDELPKEDWDQLLCNSEPSKVIAMKGSPHDSDDGYDDCGQHEMPYMSDDDDDDDDDDVNDPRVMEECMKLFSEYNPENDSYSVAAVKIEQKHVDDKEDIMDSLTSQKQRIALPGASGNLLSKPKPLVRPHKKTPAEVMLERYQKLKEEEKAVQQKLAQQRQELERHMKSAALLSSTSVSNSSVSSSSDFKVASSASPVSSTTIGLPKKRIARVPTNVAAMLKTKEQIKRLHSDSPITWRAPPSATTTPTVAMSTLKGSKRVAHVPNVDVLERPTVNIESGTKVPQNIRQRYLNCFVDETLKFCDCQSTAFKVAVAEEKICHQKATSRVVYLNIAVNTVKKLRSSQISEAAQELLQEEDDCKDVLESSSRVTSSSPSIKDSFNHPVNPNHHVVSHFSVLSSGGNKGSWSIQKSKRALIANFKEYLSGPKFLKMLKKYILNTEELEENGFPRVDPSVKGKAYIKKVNSRKKISPSDTKRYCDRCSALYEVDQWGVPLLKKPCVYHWGRAYKQRGVSGLETRYSCCQGDTQSDGCCLCSTHVSENFSPDSLTGYIRTIAKDSMHRDYGVYALDCEMCYTTNGNELTRVTVINADLKAVYETLVRPDNPIIDYNTRFSGITEEIMKGVRVRIRDVQAALLTIFSEKTILIGHSLESDFCALKIIHDTVIDTSIVFPHKLGAPYKRALRNLASEHLEKIIQNDVGGHDSAEDAITCMELMQWKVKDDLKGIKKHPQPTEKT